jgi:hypothetical protein
MRGSLFKKILDFKRPLFWSIFFLVLITSVLLTMYTISFFKYDYTLVSFLAEFLRNPRDFFGPSFILAFLLVPTGVFSFIDYLFSQSFLNELTLPPLLLGLIIWLIAGACIFLLRKKNYFRIISEIIIVWFILNTACLHVTLLLSNKIIH